MAYLSTMVLVISLKRPSEEGSIGAGKGGGELILRSGSKDGGLGLAGEHSVEEGGLVARDEGRAGAGMS